MDRRTLLARATATAPAAAVPAVALAAAQTDPHVAWAAEADRLRPIMNAADPDTADALAAWIYELHELIVDTPAHTVAGVREQARVLCHVLGLDDGEHGDGTYEVAAARNMLATLERLAGEGVT